MGASGFGGQEEAEDGDDEDRTVAEAGQDTERTTTMQLVVTEDEDRNETTMRSDAEAERWKANVGSADREAERRNQDTEQTTTKRRVAERKMTTRQAEDVARRTTTRMVEDVRASRKLTIRPCEPFQTSGAQEAEQVGERSDRE